MNMNTTKRDLTQADASNTNAVKIDATKRNISKMQPIQTCPITKNTPYNECTLVNAAYLINLKTTKPLQFNKKYHDCIKMFLILVFLIINPITVISDDTFCTQTWTYLFFSSFSAGALNSNGTHVAWGINLWGSLGYGDNTTRLAIPTVIGNATDTWKQIAMGPGMAAGIKASDGSVWAWGYNLRDTIGIINTTSLKVYTPNLISSLGTDCSVLSVLGTTYTLYCLKTNGTIWGLGDNSGEQLGAPTTSFNITPTAQPIGTDSDWAKVVPSTQDSHTCALKKNGSLYCWGQNQGQLINNTFFSISVPTMVGNSTDTWLNVYPDHEANLALKTDGTLWGWGFNLYYILCSSNQSLQIPPTQLATNLLFSYLSVSQQKVHAIAQNGTLWGWGINNFTLLNSNASVQFQYLPNLISNDTDWKSVYALLGNNAYSPTSFAIKNNGSLYSWGKNDVGQCGVGNTTSPISSPTLILSGYTFTTVADNYNAGVYGAIDTNGVIHVWGNGTNSSQFGEGATLISSTPMTCLDSTKVCKQHVCCDSSCATCNGSLNTNCLSCSSPNYYLASNNSCVSTCPVGQPNNSTRTCQLCDSSCATCNGTLNTNCLSCSSPNYYLSSNNTCGTTCPNGLFADNTTWSCVSNCPNGYFGDSSSNKCVQCDTSCTTCSGLLSTNCLSCTNPNYYLASNHSCSTTCPSNYFKDSGQVCTQCDTSCATCSNATNTGCLSCSNPNYLLASNHSCGTSCPSNYFKDSGQVCTQCDTSCATCNNATTTGCTSCSNPNYLLASNNSCSTTCPSNYFKDSGQVCTQCDTSCATCSNATNTGCLSCSNPNYLLASNHSCGTSCPSNYFKDTGQVCTQCDTSCATCSNATNTGCLSCSSPNYYYSTNHSCITNCPTNYFGDNNTWTCLQCDTSCTTCNGTLNTNCLSCTNPNYYLASNHSCSTTCPSNYFKDSGQVCTQCDTSCATCSNATNTGCLSCSNPNYLLASNHSCGTSCPSNYFKDSGQVCTHCDSSCATCNGSLNTNCTSCANPNYYLASNNSCGSTCPVGRADNSTWTCVICDVSCATCDTTNISKCLSCSSPNYFFASNNTCGTTCPSGFFADNTTWSCVTNCPNGYYGDTGTNKCLQCDTSCATCNGTLNTNCLSCSSPNYYLSSNNTCGTTCPSGLFADNTTWSCVVNCPTTYYGDTSTNKCLKCDTSCTTCNGTLNTNCLSCTNPNYFLATNHSCSTSCPNNYFKDIGQVCTQCDSSCATCANATNTGCLSCSNPNYLLASNHSCGTSCPSNYFQDSGQVCTQCDSSCATCANATNTGCLSCSSPNYLLSSNHSCNANCPNGYFNNTGQICTQCDTSCATCNGSTNTNCLSCASPNYYLASNHSCGTSCPSNYFQDSGQVCTQCDSSCATCSNATNTGCTSCSNPNYLFASNHSCNTSCPNGYFKNTGQICTQCDTSCATCNGSLNTNCLSCSSPNYYFAANNTCVSPCPVGRPDNSTRTCIICDISCATCNGSSNQNCTTCNSPYYFLATNNSCGTSCPNNYFQNSGQVCTKCDSSCATCSNSTNASCLSCSNPNYFLATNNSCVSSCPVGYYNVSQGCTKCNASCLTCSGTQASCTSCPQGQYLVYSTKQCVSSCPSNTYLQGIICLDCNSNCATCGGTSTNCTSCASGLYVTPYNNSCLPACPPNTIWDSAGSLTCTYIGNCDISCSQCFAGGVGQCTGCKDPNATLSAGLCICPTGFNLSNTTGLCVSCPTCEINLYCPNYDSNNPNCVLKNVLLPAVIQNNTSNSYYASTSWNALVQQINSTNFTSSSVPLTTNTTMNVAINAPASFGIQSTVASYIVVSVVRSSTTCNSLVTSQNIISAVTTLFFVDSTSKTILPVSGLKDGINIIFPITDPTYKQYINYIKSNTTKFPSQDFQSILEPVFKCRFFNTNTSLWEGSGLTLVEMNETTIICSTTHTTDFGIEFIDVGLDNLNDTGIPIDNSYWHVFMTTKGADNVGMYVVIVVGILYLMFSSGGFFADYLDDRRKKKEHKSVSWYLVSEGQQILDKLTTGTLTISVYPIQTLETKTDLMTVTNIGDEHARLPRAKGSQEQIGYLQTESDSPNFKRGGSQGQIGFFQTETDVPQLDSNKATTPESKNVAIEFSSDRQLQEMHTLPQSPINSPKKINYQSQIGRLTTETDVPSLDAQVPLDPPKYKELVTTLHPLFNILYMASPFYSPRPVRVLIYFISILVHLLFATIFFQSVNEPGTSITGGTILWQGIIVCIMTTVIMWLLTLLIKLPKNNISKIVEAKLNEEEINQKLSNFKVQMRLREMLLYPAGICVFIGSFIWILVFCAGNGWARSNDWLQVFTVAFLFDQVVVELGSMALLVGKSNAARKKLTIMKYEKVLLLG